MNLTFLNLEDVVREYTSGSYKPRSFWRRALDWAVPIVQRFDPIEQAHILVYNEPEVRKTGVTVPEALKYVVDAYNQSAVLYSKSQSADTLDRALIIGALWDATPIGYAFNRAVEIFIKKEFYGEAWHGKHRMRTIKHGAVEAVSSAIPVVNQIVDAVFNMYIGMAYHNIHDDAKAQLLADYKEKQKRNERITEGEFTDLPGSAYGRSKS